MEPFTFPQLEVAWRQSSQSEHQPRQLKPTDAMGKIVASYNGHSHPALERWEGTAACAVGCVVGYRDLVAVYGSEGAAKPLLFTGNARCVGWVREGFSRVTIYVVDVYYDGWHRMLVQQRLEDGVRNPRYDVRYWQPAEPRPAQLPALCKDDIEGLTGVSTSLIAHHVWQQQPDIYIGALNVFLGVRYMVKQVQRGPDTKPLWDTIMAYGFNAQHWSTPIQFTHDERVTFYAASLQPFHERTPGSQYSDLLFGEILNPRKGALRFSLATKQALSL